MYIYGEGTVIRYVLAGQLGKSPSAGKPAKGFCVCLTLVCNINYNY